MDRLIDAILDEGMLWRDDKDRHAAPCQADCGQGQAMLPLLADHQQP